LTLQDEPLSLLGDDPAMPLVGANTQIIVLSIFNVYGTTGALALVDSAE
jgi:hypothetical protein